MRSLVGSDILKRFRFAREIFTEASFLKSVIKKHILEEEAEN